MADETAFLQAIAEEPDDDALRLIFADWLDERDDPRGEFIRVQCELAGLAEDSAKRADLRDRERLLLLPPPSAMTSRSVAPWYVGVPICSHQRRRVSTAKVAVS